MGKSRRASTAPADPFGDVARPSFDTAGLHAAWAVERYCTHAKGEWFGQPLALEPWQRWLLNELYRIDPDTGLRYWRQMLVMVPRKNAKSTLVAALGFLFLVFDDEGGPEVYSAAWGEQQARNVFDAARTMWDASPALQRRTKKYARSITCPQNAGAWRVVSKLAELQQGTNPHAALIDEYHVHQRSDLFDAFKRGGQARRQPALILVTTEAAKRQTPLGDMQHDFTQTGEVEQVTPYLQVVRDHTSRSLMVRWGIPWGLRPDEVDVEDPAVVRGCNPAGWLDPQRLIAEYLHAPGSRERDFLRYHLNMLVEDDGDGISAASWDALASDRRLVDGQDVVLGVDVGLRDDCSAILAMGRVEGGLHVDCTVLTPPAELESELDLEDIDAVVMEYAARYRVRGIVADPFLAAQLMQGWAKRGMVVREFRFSPTQTGPASMFLLGIIESGELSHDGDVQLREHVLNMRMADRGTYWRFDKAADKSLKVDAGMALMMAASEFMEGETYALSDGLALV